MNRLAVTINGTWYAWKRSLDEQTIQAMRAKASARKGVFFVAGIITGILFLISAYWLFFSSALFSPRLVSLFAALGGVGLLFLFYYFHEGKQKTRELPVAETAPDLAEPPEGADVQDLSHYMDETAQETLFSAYQFAKKFGHAELEPFHLFIAGLEDDRASIAFGRLGLEFDDMKDPLGRRLETRQLGSNTRVGEAAQRVLLEAFVDASMRHRPTVSAFNIFVHALQADDYLQELLQEFEVDQEMFAQMVEWIHIQERLRERYEQYRTAAMFKPTGPMNRSMTSVATPMLDRISEDLTAEAVAGQLPMMIDRSQEVASVFRVIEGGRQSAVLVGPEGVGKHTILAGIAELMVREDVPDVLEDMRLVRISIPHLIAGATPEDAQERLITILNEVIRARNIILVVSDIDQLTQATGSGINLASTFVDFLNRGATFTIATTTPRAYVESVERSVLSRAFEKVTVHEPEPKIAIQMLESKIGAIEHDHNVIFQYDALAAAVEFSDRYMHEAYLPKKAIELCREVAAHVAGQKGEDGRVTRNDIATVVTEKTGVKATAAQTDEKAALLNMEERLHERVVGQDEAVDAVSSALRRARTQLSDAERPIATFLFLGPTGVGKTELAKTIAGAYFGDRENMIRVDMSEYQDSESIYRLIGRPGENQGGHLTEAVRTNPSSIVLLDEFEKAHPDILNVFLQVFDDGRLTDNAGRTIDFTNTILVATSNAGSAYIQEAVREGATVESIKTHLIQEELKGVYRPELLNRFDGIIVFKTLSQEEIVQIARLMITQVAKRLEPKGIGFRATDEAVERLAEKGYDPAYGARPLRRVIQDEVDDAIAQALLEGAVKRRDTIVLNADGSIDIEQGKAL